MNYKEYKVKVYTNGNIYWYNQDNQLHREDGPAIEYANGGKEWCLNGELHREDGPAVECADGDKYWYLNGKLHRENGPAIDCANGSKSWYLNGDLHREDGPAIEYASGSKYWYLNGEQLSEKEWKKQTSKNTCHNKTVEIDGKKFKLVEI